MTQSRHSSDDQLQQRTWTRTNGYAVRGSDPCSQTERDSFSFLLNGRRDYDEASNDANAEAFTADNRPVGA
jgi:hypothetical protein